MVASSQRTTIFAPVDPAAFDQYYVTVHMPLVVQLPNARSMSVERCEPFGADIANAYLIARLEFDNRDELEAGLSGPEGQAAVSYFANFATGGATVHVTSEAFPVQH